MDIICLVTRRLRVHILEAPKRVLLVCPRIRKGRHVKGVRDGKPLHGRRPQPTHKTKGNRSDFGTLLLAQGLLCPTLPAVAHGGLTCGLPVGQTVGGGRVNVMADCPGVATPACYADFVTSGMSPTAWWMLAEFCVSRLPAPGLGEKERCGSHECRCDEPGH